MEQYFQNQPVNLYFAQKPDSNPYVFNALSQILLQAPGLLNMNASCCFYVRSDFLADHDSASPNFCQINFSCCLNSLLSF